MTEEALSIHHGLYSRFIPYDCTYDPFLRTYLRREDVAIIVRLRNYESKVSR